MQEEPPSATPADEDMTDASLEGAAAAPIVSSSDPHPALSQEATSDGVVLECPPHPHKQVQSEPPKAQVEAPGCDGAGAGLCAVATRTGQYSMAVGRL